MVLPGRKYSAGSGYRYGFNGKEYDGESGFQDYGMRIYDKRLGKFLSVDPLTKEYPWYSPFQFAGNSPVSNIDLDGGEPKESNNPNLKGKENRMWLVNKAFNRTGGDKEYDKSPKIYSLGTNTKEVDKTKFFANNKNDDLNRSVNEESQFLVNENVASSEKDLVNKLLGDFIYGAGPENLVFEHNGQWSNSLKRSISVGESLAKWNRSNQKDGVYYWNMDLRGEINVDMNSGLTSLEHFLGSVSTKISTLNAEEIKVEIFNVTSLTSGDINKDLPFGLGPSPLKSTVKKSNTPIGLQLDHTNMSQYFSFTMKKSEYEKIIKQFDPGSSVK